MKKINGGYGCSSECSQDYDCPNKGQDSIWTKCWSFSCDSTTEYICGKPNNILLNAFIHGATILTFKRQIVPCFDDKSVFVMLLIL